MTYARLFPLFVIAQLIFFVGFYQRAQVKQDKYEEHIETEEVSGHKVNPNLRSVSIQIIIVVELMAHIYEYRFAIDSIKCYAKIHNYAVNVVLSNSLSGQCDQKDKFFRRHCVVANNLRKADYTLFIDADMGVVNPMKKLEDYVDFDKEIVFYDRFYNHEVAAGSYFVHNSSWSYWFLMNFADYEDRLYPYAFHGTDNGALHAYFLEVIYPGRKEAYQYCLDFYKLSKNNADLFAFVSCCRTIMGIGEDFGKIKVLRKGSSWTRDAWLTNSLWNPDMDFMLHGWKYSQLRNYTNDMLPISPTPISNGIWFNPLNGPIELNRCNPR